MEPISTARSRSSRSSAWRQSDKIAAMNETGVARQYELGPGETAWPTVALFLLALTAQAASTALALSGEWPAALAVLVNFVCAYAQFTVVHDAVHRAVSRRRWLNEAVGSAATLILFGPFSAFRRNHLRHHAHTNDPEKDPDFWVAGSTATGTFLRCLVMLQMHYILYFRDALRGDLAWPRTAAVIPVIAGLFLLGGMKGWAGEMLLYWFLPAQLAVAALAFLFDYWPHRPHAERGRLRDTAAIAPRPLDPLFLAQNLHLVHHLIPTIPWYRYRPAFAALEPGLRLAGARIWDLRTALARLNPALTGRPS